MKYLILICMTFFIITKSKAQICIEELDNYNAAEISSSAMFHKINGLTQIYNQGIYGNDTPEKMYNNIKEMEMRFIQLLAEARNKNREYNECYRKVSVKDRSEDAVKL